MLSENIFNVMKPSNNVEVDFFHLSDEVQYSIITITIEPL